MGEPQKNNILIPFFYMRIFLHLFTMFFLTQSAYADVHFLSLSDIHYGSDNTRGDGHDTDKVLFSSALSKFSHLANQVDFIITLGDFSTHLWGKSPKKATYVKTVFHGLYQADHTAKPMFYISGNNDPLQGNYQPFSSNGKSLLTQAQDWQGACVHCDGLIIDGTHMFDEGYYSSYVLPGNKDIVLIVLNSIQFTNSPFFIPNYPHQDRDALQQLKWLDIQLKKHHTKQLLIAMHVPPGKDYKGRAYWHEHYLKQFIHLLNTAYPRYGQISLLTSHSHMDDIRKIRLDNGMNIYAYATPSISRIHHNNPAMKVFDLDANMKFKNYTTYYTTHDEQWKNEHYSALGDTNSLFPQCHNEWLVNCLDSLTNDTLCKILKDGQFYGVKNPRVDGSVCKLTYPVN